MMKNTFLSNKVLAVYSLFFMLLGTTISAQVGIGTVTPDPSSILDITSTTQGMLAPRLTTAQRLAIATPANGLMVFDTDVKTFYYYSSTSSVWIKMFGDADGRLKYKLIKSTDVLATVLAAEKAAGGGSKYLMDVNTYYEINGTINFDLPIDLNNAYISGIDANEDKLVRATGNLFDGATGGSLRNVTIVVSGGGKVFNLSGTAAQNIIIRDLVIANSSNVGSITGFGLVFVSIVQYVGNTTGIVYDSITKLLISNAAWFGNNAGTYEKLQGTFGLISKQGGFSEVNGTSVGFDVSSNPTITGDAVMETVVFTGTVSSGKYVNGYNPALYTGYFFNNKWNVRCAGIPTESDAVSTGDANLDYPVGFGATTVASTTPVKLAGITTSTNLFRFSTGGTDNKLIYLGSKRRYFRTAATFSFRSSVSGVGVFVFYLAKNGVVIGQSKVYCGVASSDVDAGTILSTVEMSTNDYLEVWLSRYSGTGDVLAVSMNLVVN
ncbi:MAG: hypothetical protein GZ087_08650 [Flavobacterium sp.]|nr:hypothetical protein [Flavobacterium sp.]